MMFNRKLSLRICAYLATLAFVAELALSATINSAAGQITSSQRAESRSITVSVNDPGSTGGLLLAGASAGTGPNLAETMNTR